MRRSLAVLALAGALVAQDAAAQFRLPRIKNPLAQAVAGNQLKTGRVAFDNDVLEITGPRVDQFLRGMAAEQRVGAEVEAQDLEAIDRQNSAARRAWDRDREAYERAKAAHERCAQGEASATQASLGGAIPSAGDRARIEEVGKRIQAAQQAGNMGEAMRLADSLMKAVAPANQQVIAASSGLEGRALAKCGQPPAEPARPALRPVLTYADVMQAGITASGFTETQYRIIRERIAPFVLSNGASSTMVYDPGEVPVLRESLPRLAPFSDVLKRY